MSEWKHVDTAPVGRVLMWVEGGGEKGSGIAAFGTIYRYEDGDMTAKPDGYHGKWNVTHWMPIPKAPEGEK